MLPCTASSRPSRGHEALKLSLSSCHLTPGLLPPQTFLTQILHPAFQFTLAQVLSPKPPISLVLWLSSVFAATSGFVEVWPCAVAEPRLTDLRNFLGLLAGGDDLTRNQPQVLGKCNATDLGFSPSGS
jgi:hypothetical protein